MRLFWLKPLFWTVSNYHVFVYLRKQWLKLCRNGDRRATWDKEIWHSDVVVLIQAQICWATCFFKQSYVKIESFSLKEKQNRASFKCRALSYWPSSAMLQPIYFRQIMFFIISFSIGNIFTLIILPKWVLGDSTLIWFHHVCSATTYDSSWLLAKSAKGFVYSKCLPTF